jgi:hypothetical protein
LPEGKKNAPAKAGRIIFPALDIINEVAQTSEQYRYIMFIYKNLRQYNGALS